MTRCKSCGRAIVWLKTATGKMMPVDATVPAAIGAVYFNPAVHTSHFVTCPQAATHRKPKESKPCKQN